MVEYTTVNVRFTGKIAHFNLCVIITKDYLYKFAL